jgi:putative membrane protein insertion efficiency factor
MLQKLAVALIRFYQKFISPLKPPTCRFVPSCSQYGLLAIQKHGFWLGSWYTLKRLAKCHPFHPGGFDPVPERKKE